MTVVETAPIAEETLIIPAHKFSAAAVAVEQAAVRNTVSNQPYGPPSPEVVVGNTVTLTTEKTPARFAQVAEMLRSRKLQAAAVLLVALTIGGVVWKTRKAKSVAKPAATPVVPAVAKTPGTNPPAAPVPAPQSVSVAAKPAASKSVAPSSLAPPPRPIAPNPGPALMPNAPSANPATSNSTPANAAPNQPLWRGEQPGFTLPRTAAGPRPGDNAALPIVTDATREPLPSMPMAFPNPYVVSNPQTSPNPNAAIAGRNYEIPRMTALPRPDQTTPTFPSNDGARFEGMIQPLPATQYR
ncbi:MAG: hypothetical protein QM811_28405 [Pirellulales bacterium]